MNKLSLTSNQLKIIAIITMIIDHIGYYFSYLLNSNVYLAFRIVGRISMPIFVFLIVEGYFNTSNLKNYIKRLFILALVTQIILLFVNIINVKYVPNYIVSVTSYFNIVFSFVFILILLYLIGQIIENKNYLYIALIPVIIFIYYFIDLDYGFMLPIIALILYLTKVYTNNKNIYKILISTGILLVGIIAGQLNICMILSLPFILLYNGNLGKDSIWLKRLFYYIFPLQHLIIYLSATLIYMRIM